MAKIVESWSASRRKQPRKEAASQSFDSSTFSHPRRIKVSFTRASTTFCLFLWFFVAVTKTKKKICSRWITDTLCDALGLGFYCSVRPRPCKGVLDFEVDAFKKRKKRSQLHSPLFFATLVCILHAKSCSRSFLCKCYSIINQPRQRSGSTETWRPKR